jgi:hypothetical protein
METQWKPNPYLAKDGNKGANMVPENVTPRAQSTKREDPALKDSNMSTSTAVPSAPEPVSTDMTSGSKKTAAAKKPRAPRKPWATKPAQTKAPKAPVKKPRGKKSKAVTEEQIPPTAVIETMDSTAELEAAMAEGDTTEAMDVDGFGGSAPSSPPHWVAATTEGDDDDDFGLEIVDPEIVAETIQPKKLAKEPEAELAAEPADPAIDELFSGYYEESVRSVRAESVESEKE